MAELTITFEDKTLLPVIRKLINALPGVSITSTRTRRPAKTKIEKGLEEAYADLKAGRVTRYETAEDMFEAMGI